MATRDLLLNIVLVTGIALAICGLIFAVSLFPAGPRDLSLLENIDGVPYVADSDGGLLVSEELAHADVYLKEPILLKQMRIKVDFDPLDLDRLAVGVRENEFWLSYEQNVIYNRHEPGSGRRTKEIVVPLTDKLQDKDRSVDLMFFAKTPTSTEAHDRGPSDDSLWKLYDVSVSVERVWPNVSQLKNFFKAVISRERPL